MRTKLSAASTLLFMLAACGETKTFVEPQEEDAAAAAPAPVGGEGGAGGVEVPEPVGPDALVAEADAAPSQAFLAAINTLGFTRSTSPGVAPGFNLDDRVSDARDDQTCRKADFTSPEGEPGIDNQLATLVPLFEVVGISAVEGLVQNSIKEGGLLVMLSGSGLDDLENDPEISLNLRLGQGVPLLGTDGLLLSGQTFHLHPETQDAPVENARIEDGVLRGGPFEATLPIVVFGVRYDFPIHHAFLKADVTYDGGLVNGVLGGEVNLSDLVDIATQATAFDAGILTAVKGILNGRGDLAPDASGVCQRISGAFDFTAVSAFLY